jgi:hypothetical protein
MMNQPDKDVLCNLRGFDPVTRHMQGKPEHRWIVHSIYLRKRLAVTFPEPR